MTRRGLLLILSSPSGAGKSTLSQMLMAWDPTMRFSVSATTRPPRLGEVDGKEYCFLDRDAFAELVAAGQMLEHAEVFENFYGSPREPVEEAMKRGQDVLFDIDWQGAQQIRQTERADATLVFILPPSIEELDKRLRCRAQDSNAEIAKRMAKSRDEISHWAEYDYVLVNDSLEQTFEKLKAILEVERMRRDRQPQLSAFVRALNEEFESR